METISAEKFNGSITDLLAKVISSRLPLVISTENAQPVVMLSLAEFQSLQETLYLLSNTANAAHLRKSIADLDNNRGVVMEFAEL